MSWKKEVFMKIEALKESVQGNKYSLGEHVDKLEDGAKAREKERNVLLQRAFKKVYDSINSVDKKMVAKIKTDAYDTTRQLDKVQRELQKLMANVKKADDFQEGAMKLLLQKLNADNLNIDVDSVTSMCNVSVGCNVLEMEAALVETALHAIYLKQDTFDLKMLEVKVADDQTKQTMGLFDPKYAHYVISSQVGIPEGALKNLSVYAVAGEVSRDGVRLVSVLNSTVAEMRQKNQMVMADGINSIVLKIKRPSRLSEATVFLTVSFFKTVLRGCPAVDIVSSGLNSEDLADMTATAKEQLNGTVHDDLDLDDEDRQSLDITRRMTNKAASSAMPTLAIQSNPALPTAMGTAPLLRKEVTNGMETDMPYTAMQSDGPCGVTNGTETALPPTSIQSNGSYPAPPYGIINKGIESAMPMQSSMPATAMQTVVTSPLPPPASRGLTNGVHSFSVTNSPSIPSSKAAGIKKVPNLSDVREVTGEVDGTMPFSPKPGQGMVSTMRATAMAQKLSGALSKVKKAKERVEVLEQNNEVDLVLGASSSAHNIEDMQKSLSSAESSRENDSLHLEGPDVQEIAVHNRSVSFANKTNIVQDLTTPQIGRMQQRFRVKEGDTKVRDGQAGVVKRLVKQRQVEVNQRQDEAQQQDEAQRRDYEDVNGTELDDPHLYLNASKAPSPTLADHTLPCDPAWNEGIGAVHEWVPSPLKKDESFATKAGIGEKTKMDFSIWDEPDDHSNSPRDIRGFNLTLGLVNQIGITLPGHIGGSKYSMQSPVHIEYVPTFSKFLISEPEYHRIGVYSKGSLQFQGWFGARSDSFKYPTSILYLDNGYLVVLERSKINIYDKDAKLVQKISGRFNGLAKDLHGNFITTKQSGDQTTFIAIIGQNNREGIYDVKDSFPIQVTNKGESKVRFLAFHAGNIYASDYGLNSIYVVDLETRNLATWELKFDIPCSKPCGMVLDDCGNVLLADSGNNRLIVLNKEGQLFREILIKEKIATTPSDIVKVRGKGADGAEEDHILVTYAGSDGTDGRLVRLKCT